MCDDWDEVDYQQTDIDGLVYDVIPVDTGQIVMIVRCIPNPHKLSLRELDFRLKHGWKIDELKELQTEVQGE